MKRYRFSFKIGELTNSIQDTKSKQNYDTEVTMLAESDLKRINSKDWKFKWKVLFHEKRSEGWMFYKLTIKGNSKIQALIPFTEKQGFLFLNLIESLKANKGRNKKFEGCLGNLVAFACKVSAEKGFGGYVSFDSKTRLIDHYKKVLGAEILYGYTMVIRTESARKLIDKYFKNS